MLAVLVAALFVVNADTVLDHPGPFARVLATVFCFLALPYLLGEAITRRLGLTYPERALDRPPPDPPAV